MPKNKGWFRVYDRMIDSPQILELNDSEFRLIVSLWCLASAEGKNGEISYTAAALRRRIMPDHSQEEVNKMIEHLIELDLLAEKDGHYLIPRWEIHQYEYNSRIPKNRTDLKKNKEAKDEINEDIEDATENNKNTNGKFSESERKENGKIDTDTESDTDKDINNNTITYVIAQPEGCDEMPDETNLIDIETLDANERKVVKAYESITHRRFKKEWFTSLKKALSICYPAQIIHAISQQTTIMLQRSLGPPDFDYLLPILENGAYGKRGVKKNGTDSSNIKQIHREGNSKLYSDKLYTRGLD